MLSYVLSFVGRGLSSLRRNGLVSGHLSLIVLQHALWQFHDVPEYLCLLEASLLAVLIHQQALLLRDGTPFPCLLGFIDDFAHLYAADLGRGHEEDEVAVDAPLPIGRGTWCRS